MKRFTLLFVLVLALLLPQLTGAANAQLGLHIGVQKAQDADNANNIFGAILRSKVQEWGIEASIDYRQEKFYDGLVTVRSWPVMLTLLYYPVPVLHADLGVGWYNTTIDYNNDLENIGADDYTDQRIGWHFGGGVEFPFEKFGITADLRYVFIDYDWKYVPGSGGRKGNFYMLTFGILFSSH